MQTLFLTGLKMLHKKIQEYIFVIFRLTGIPFLCRTFIARKKLTVIMYHNPSPEIFRKHAKFLSTRYSFITQSDLIRFFDTAEKFKLPDYPLLVTFDDGWKENFALVGILKEFGIRPVIFLTSHLIDTERNFWFTVCKPVEINRFKSMPDSERISKMKSFYNFDHEKEFPGNRQVLNAKELTAMKEVADFGCHSSFHAILTRCNPTERRTDVIQSTAKINEFLGYRPLSFCFPNGDYDSELIEILKHEGYLFARTTDAGWNSAKTNRFRLKVTGVSDYGSVAKLSSELTGISMYIQYLLKGSLRGRKP